MDGLGILLALIILALFVFSRLLERNIYNPVSFFCLLFFVVFMLPSINLYGWVKVDYRIYLLCFSGVVAFVWGGLITMRHPVSINSKNAARPQLRIWIYYLLLALTISYQILYSGRVLSLLLRGRTMGQIRFMASNDYAIDNGFNVLTRSRIDSIINRNLVKPTVNILIPISIVRSINQNGTINIKNLFLMLILCSLETFRTGGRFILVICIFQYFTYYLFANKKIHFSGKQRRFIRIGIVSLAIGVGFFTYMRKDTATLNSLFKEFYVYYGGALTNFSIRFDELISKPKTYGFCFAFPYTSIIYRALRAIIGFSDPKAYIQALNVVLELQKKVYVSETQTFNAFVTLFYYFYLDFGFIGTLLLSFLYGVICSSVYNSMKKNGDLLASASYLWIINGLTYSMVRWQFYASAYAYGIIVLLLLFSRHKVSLKVKR